MCDAAAIAAVRVAPEHEVSSVKFAQVVDDKG